MKNRINEHKLTLHNQLFQDIQSSGLRQQIQDIGHFIVMP